MIIVRISKYIYRIILLFILVSCKITTEKPKVVVAEVLKDTILYDYSNIETISYFSEKDSLNEGFDLELINKFPVKKKDTVLFRKMEVDEENKFLFKTKKTNYGISFTKYCNFYKTGENRFSTQEIILKNKSIDEDVFTFYGYANYTDKDLDIYSLYAFSSLPKIKKTTFSKGVFDFSRINRGEFYMDFEIKKDEIHITKITEEISYFTDKSYELDTLIIINKDNKYIDVCRLYDATQKEKNLKK